MPRVVVSYRRCMPRRTSLEERQDIVTRRLAQLTDLAVDTAPETTPEAGGGEWWEAATRVRPVTPAPARSAAPNTSPAGPEPSSFPLPGRHAALRPGAGLAARVPLTPAHLTVVALLVAVGLAVTAWWVVRSDAGPPLPAAEALAAPDLVGPVVAAAQPELNEATVTVDVAGRVRRPGIVVLDGGARVVDALEHVGGPRPGVDLSTINLARELVDGEQILVGLPGVGATPTVPGGAPPAGSPPALVDLNLANLDQLETLPDVGPVTAAAIVAWRDEHGSFTAVTELIEVDGIGDVTLEKLTPLVTV